MTGALERRYRRSLRAYPPAWRAENEEVVLGTLLDVAESEGRDRPAPGERWTLATDGLAHRLDRRVALVAAVTAFAASTGGAIVSLFLAVELSAIGLGWLASALLLGVAPIGLVVSIAALLRSTHRIGALSALAALALVVPAAGAAFTAVTLWSSGFDAADAGRPVSAGETSLMLGSLVIAWALGSASLWLLSRPLFGRRVLPAVGGVLAAVVATPILGYALFSPLTGIAFAAGVVVIALVGGRASTPLSSTPLSSTLERPVTPAREAVPAPAAGAGAFAVFVATSVAGLVAIVVALTGGLWLPGFDGTEAMNLGLGLGSLTAAVTVAVAVGSLVRSRVLPLPGAVAAVFGPVVTGAGQLTAGIAGGDPWVSWMMGSALVGVAVAFLVARAVRRRYPTAGPVAALASGGLAGVGYAAIPGLLVTAYLPFAAPILSGVLALSIHRRRRPAAGVPVELAPSYL